MPTHYARIVSLKHSSVLNTRSNDFILWHIECVTSRKQGNHFRSCCEGVAGEGSLVGVSKFHSWCKCTIPLININSDWMSNASSALCIILYYAGPLFRILGCNNEAACLVIPLNQQLLYNACITHAWFCCKYHKVYTVKVGVHPYTYYRF